MQRFLTVAVLWAVVLVSLSTCMAIQKPAAPAQKVQQSVHQQVHTLNRWYQQEWLPALTSGAAIPVLKQKFAQGRILYKEAEWAIEYFMSGTARNLNGAPLPEIEVEEHLVLEASGFGVMEELLFEPDNNATRKELLRESAKWASLLTRVVQLWQTTEPSDEQIFTGLRLQLLRIAALGLSGFDAPLAQTSLPEIAASLQGISNAAAAYENGATKKEVAQIKKLVAEAKRMLQQHTFNDLPRLSFIQTIINPADAALGRIQKALHLALPDFLPVQWGKDAFFKDGQFNINAFTPDQNSWPTADKTVLGAKLFADPVLSLSNKISCASCHQPDKVFTDGLVKNKSFDGSQNLLRNTPTLLYAGLQQAQFYSMQATHLEDQVRNVIENRDEMHGSLKNAVAALQKNNDYQKAFAQTFKDGITERNIQVALASYVRSLKPFASRFDAALKEAAQLSAEESKGFDVFMGKAKCGSCHFMPLFNGTTPPHFTNTEAEVIGVPADALFTKVDGDSGRYNNYKIEELRSAFKTPTLRNVARTAPYMHNGVYKTLEEVVDFYDAGGAAGRGFNLPNQTLPPDSLRLTKEEKQALVKFMHTLSDSVDKQ